MTEGFGNKALTLNELITRWNCDVETIFKFADDGEFGLYFPRKLLSDCSKGINYIKFLKEYLDPMIFQHERAIEFCDKELNDEDGEIARLEEVERLEEVKNWHKSGYEEDNNIQLLFTKFITEKFMLLVKKERFFRLASKIEVEIFNWCHSGSIDRHRTEGKIKSQLIIKGLPGDLHFGFVKEGDDDVVVPIGRFFNGEINDDDLCVFLPEIEGYEKTRPNIFDSKTSIESLQLNTLVSDEAIISALAATKRAKDNSNKNLQKARNVRTIAAKEKWKHIMQEALSILQNNRLIRQISHLAKELRRSVASNFAMRTIRGKISENPEVMSRLTGPKA